MNNRLESLRLFAKKAIHDVARIDGESLFEREIGDMVSGESGWTVPWALSHGKLREDYPILENSFGTAELRVHCVKPHEYETHLRPFRQEIYHLPPLAKQTTNRIVITPEICPGCGASAWTKLSRTEMQCAYCGRVICL